MSSDPCLCGDRECRRCYPGPSKRERMLADDDYGDWLYERRKQDRLDRAERARELDEVIKDIGRLA